MGVLVGYEDSAYTVEVTWGSSYDKMIDYEMLANEMLNDVVWRVGEVISVGEYYNKVRNVLALDEGHALRVSWCTTMLNVRLHDEALNVLVYDKALTMRV